LIFLKAKPLSVNECWQGKRFKTKKYKAYEQELLLLLPNITVPDGYLRVDLEFGFSNKCSDWDNPIKPFIDILQSKYEFNDRMIKKASVNIKHCNKGAEYVAFKIESMDYKA